MRPVVAFSEGSAYSQATELAMTLAYYHNSDETDRFPLEDCLQHREDVCSCLSRASFGAGYPCKHLHTHKPHYEC